MSRQDPATVKREIEANTCFVYLLALLMRWTSASLMRWRKYLKAVKHDSLRKSRFAFFPSLCLWSFKDELVKLFGDRGLEREGRGPGCFEKSEDESDVEPPS